MVIVTTLSYAQLSSLIRDKQVSLNNEDLVFGQTDNDIRQYLLSRIGGSGYVMGIQGRINTASVNLLSQLDNGLEGDRVTLEASVEEDDVIRFDVQGLEEAIKYLSYGLPTDLIYEQLDESIRAEDSEDTVQIICTHALRKEGDIRITSLNRDININAEGITFVRL